MGKGHCDVPVEITSKFFNKEVPGGEVNGFYFKQSFICEFFLHAKYTVEYSECKRPEETNAEFDIRMKTQICADKNLALRHCELGNKIAAIKAEIQKCKDEGYALCKGYGGTARRFTNEKLIKENIEPFGLI